MSVWQLAWDWVALYLINSYPSHLPACCQQFSPHPYQLTYSASLWINCICTLFALELQNLLPGFLTAIPLSCKGEMQKNHLSSLCWQTLFQRLFIPPLCLWHAWFICPFSLPLPCYNEYAYKQLDSPCIQERTFLKGLLQISTRAFQN